MSAEQLREALEYDAATGSLKWRRREMAHRRGSASWNSRYAGREAMTALSKRGGYPNGTITVDGHVHKVRAHNVIWCIVHGRWPAGQIDHINGDKTDNRLANLRETDSTGNARNKKKPVTNTTGHVGVRPSRNRKGWIATIGHTRGGHSTHIGTFATLEDAIAARKQAEHERGYHENHGR